MTWPMAFPLQRCVDEKCRQLVPWAVAVPVPGPREEQGQYRHPGCVKP